MDNINLVSPTLTDLRKFSQLSLAGTRIVRRKDCQKLLQLLISTTDFLPLDAKPSQRFWHISHNLFEIPRCPSCMVGFLSYDHKTAMDYLPNCSECNKIAGKEKRKQTFIANYGVENPQKSEAIREKTKHTNILKYGVENPQKSEAIREKTKHTNILKYGVENPACNPTVRAKASNTVYNRYGRLHPNQEHITDSAWKILNDATILTTMHHDDKFTLRKIAKQLNVDPSTVSDYFDTYGIEKKRFKQSDAEHDIQTTLESAGFIVEVRKRDLISSEIDLFIPSHKLAIEYNGIYWHSEARWSNANSIHYDKWKECREKGIRLLTIFENEWLAKPDLIKNKILSILGKCSSRTVYARKAIIREVSSNEKKEFFDSNHIQGDGPSSINYGLEYNETLVACIGFIKQKDHFILNRYATSCNVPGGFTKLLTHFERMFGNPKIVTFADLRWSEGDLYKNTGFILDSELKPDYYWTRGAKLWHKFNWRHTSGLKKLKDYDPNKSETENMHNHGYHRIWDCGKLRFVKNCT